MTAKEYCKVNPAIAYASRNAGLEIHGIEYGINDYVYAVSGAWAGAAAHSYHRARIDYTAAGRAFFRIFGGRVYLDECIKM
ncbi:hypothetical protein DW839_01840 [Enterocloster bolteae]|uniref:Uncharacterized protein n=1 Tax=Enterocloster bolteae TaxID=208479 RepID=A0A414AZY6_9FIRM|nr:hypothetical protein DW839_01840 [Enterocloster bolteae]